MLRTLESICEFFLKLTMLNVKFVYYVHVDKYEYYCIIGDNLLVANRIVLFLRVFVKEKVVETVEN